MSGLSPLDTAALSDTQRPDCFRLLGIPVSIVTMGRAVDYISEWAQQQAPRMIFVREVPSLMMARKEITLRNLHETADMVVPDGMPLVWAGKMNGYKSDIGRVCGADLLDAVCERSLKTGQTHYFYGGKPSVAHNMAQRLRKKYPGLQVVGIYSPPMRSVGPDFTLQGDALREVEEIKRANPDFIWVGISSPKQEYWMAQAAPVLGRGVCCGIGAAFDFHAGAVKRAPKWMQANGLEWLHRLFSEPRRLWRRYLLQAPQFVGLALWEQLKGRLSGQRNR